MSDDFVRLVSQANPAFRQYQPANTGYPPSSSPHALDPFFDDDDDAPDSAFGRSPAAMQSKESGLPLSRSAAPPAGHSQLSLPQTIQPDQWSFDDDSHNSKPFAGSSSFPGPSASPPKHQRKSSKSFAKSFKSFKWPWQKKEQALTGTRAIALNNPDANSDFCSNYVSTSKYNVATFVPKFLFGLFSPRLPPNAAHPPPRRAILEVCQLVLPLHRPHTTDTWCLTHQSLYYHCTPRCCTTSFRLQGNSGGLGECSYSSCFFSPPCPRIRALASPAVSSSYPDVVLSLLSTLDTDAASMLRRAVALTPLKRQ